MNTGAGVLAIRQGKGKRDRFVPVGEQWSEAYRDAVRPQHALPSSPENLFLDETGKARNPHKVSRAVKKYVKQSAIDKVGSCHLFRHTMATLMLENGADLRFIQQLLGHSQVSTTEIYTHVATHKLKEIHTATHPAKARQSGPDGAEAKESSEPTEAELWAALEGEAEEEKD